MLFAARLLAGLADLHLQGSLLATVLQWHLDQLDRGVARGSAPGLHQRRPIRRSLAWIVFSINKDNAAGVTPEMREA